MRTTIEHHKSLLANMQSSLAEEEARLARMVATVERLKRQAQAYADQIAEAERRGLAAFDDTRFLKPRKVA